MKTIASSFFLLISAILVSPYLYAQFPPPAGRPGSTAIHMDSSILIGWASDCEIVRGYINMADTTITYNEVNKATYGSYLYGSGPADGLVISLGDYGTALLVFDIPVINGPGPDFAVFENSFGDSFLELGFVDVSSDGIRYVRFPSISLTAENTQVGTFDTIDATKIHNLAGKYRMGYGTPFDLDDLIDSTGIDLNHITHIRISDAGGCIVPPFTTMDSQGHIINDPWPTPFDTGGFDFDAIGVIHNTTEGYAEGSPFGAIKFYPNPVKDKIIFESKASVKIRLKITDIFGKLLLDFEIAGKAELDLSSFPAGVYMANCTFQDGSSITKKIIKY